MVYASYLIEENLSQSQINQLTNDKRVQLKFPYLFCLKEHKQILEQTYNILFFNDASVLYNLFASELSEQLKIFLDELLDFKIMIQDDFRLCIPSNELFYKDFEKYLLKLRIIFLESVNWLLRNFDLYEDIVIL
jgi:hypothetical protein